MQPQYRLTVFAPKSVDATEATVLTPASGAPHSDPFRIATISGLSGYQPYMGLPSGRRGKFDPLTRQLEHGTLTVPILDARTTAGGSNASRWVSAFTGASDGAPQLVGCKAKVEWRKDPSAAWADYWVGRIKRVRRDGMIVTALELGDMADDLDYEIGRQRPHPSATGVVAPSLFPLGLTADYGTVKAYSGKGRFTGTVQTAGGGIRYIQLDQAGLGRPDNVLSSRLGRLFPVLNAGSIWDALNVQGGLGFSTGLRLRFSSTSPSITDKELIPKSFTLAGLPFGGQARLARIRVDEIQDSADPFYQAFDTTTVPDGTTVTFDIREERDPTIFVGSGDGIHPVQLLADIVDGYYGPLTQAGAVSRAVARESSSFTTLLADTSIPKGRFRLARMGAQDFIERHLCQPYQLGYRVNESGQVVVFSTALPTSLGGLPTIADADLSSPVIEWEASRAEAITEFYVKGYHEIPLSPQEIADYRSRMGEDPPIGGLVEWPNDYFEPFFAGSASVNLRPRRHTIDAIGFRSMPNETTASGLSKYDQTLAEAARLAAAYRPQYSRGTQTVRFRCRRTATAESVYPGAWILLNTTYGPPNPATNQVGGTRLIQVTSRDEDGLELVFGGIDAGPGVLATAPTVGTPAQEAGNTKYGFTCSVTLNASGEPATLWVNYTSTGVGTRPGDSDAGWHVLPPIGSSDGRITSSGTKTFRFNPPGKRAWVRVRTEGVSGGGSAKLPSAWAYPSGTGYVDLGALAAPSSVAVSGVTAKYALVTWTPGESSAPALVLLGSGASQAAASASTPTPVSPLLPPGTNRYDLTGLDTGGPWYKAQVCHVDAFGNRGAVAGTTPTSFQATGTSATAPTPAALLVLNDSTTNGVAPSNQDGIVAVGQYGVRLLLVLGPTGIGYDAKIYRDGVHVETIASHLIQGQQIVWQDNLPNDNTSRTYKFKLAGPHVADSADSPTVTVKPGWLPPMALTAQPGEAVLGQSEFVYVPAPAFIPHNDGISYRLGHSTLGSGMLVVNGTTQLTFYAAIVPALPQGVTVTAIQIAGLRKTSGAVLTADLRYFTSAGVSSSSVASVSRSVSASFGTDGASASHKVANPSYFIELTMKNSAAAEDTVFEWVRLTVVRDSNRQ